MTDVPAHLAERIEPLRRRIHLERNTVLPLVGAELPGLAPFHDLLARSVNDVDDSEIADELREALGKERFGDIATTIESDLLLRPRLLARIQTLYSRPGAKPPRLYNLLAALPVNHFATTAYHPWLRDALAHRLGHTPRVYVPDDPGGLADLGPASPRLVLMLHGDSAPSRSRRSGGCA